MDKVPKQMQEAAWTGLSGTWVEDERKRKNGLQWMWAAGRW